MKRAEQLLLFLVLFFLPTQLGKHFWPNFSHIFSLRIDYLSPTIYFWDILVLILITIFLINRKAFSKTSLNLGLFFLLTQIISLLAASLLVNNLNIGAALVRVAQYAIALLFGLYIASNKETSKRVLFFGISSAVIFQSLLGISQLISEKTIGFWILGERSFSISTPAITKLS